MNEKVSLSTQIIYMAAGLLMLCQQPLSAKAFTDHFEACLEPAQWQNHENIMLTQERDSLGIAASLDSEIRSAWVSSSSRWTATPEISVSIEAETDQTTLIGQVEWFDRSGTFLRVEPFCRVENARSLKESVTLSRPENAASFGIKLWLEGRSGSATINRLEIELSFSWRQPVEAVQSLTVNRNKTEPEESLQVKFNGTTAELILEPGASSSAVVFNDQITSEKANKTLIPIIELSPGSSLSLQLLCWDSSGDYLSSVTLLSDAAEASDYEISIADGDYEIPENTEFYSVKVWYGGKPGSRTRLGSLQFANPE